MHGIKIPQYEFALKMQGGLMREGHCGTHICTSLVATVSNHVTVEPHYRNESNYPNKIKLFHFLHSNSMEYIN